MNSADLEARTQCPRRLTFVSFCNGTKTGSFEIYRNRLSNQLLGWAVVPGTPLQVGSMFLLVLARKYILAILKRTLGKYGHFTSHLTLGSETPNRKITNS